MIPATNKDCYQKSQDSLKAWYQVKINDDGLKKLNEAKNIWAAKPDGAEALKVADLISKINPNASCINQVNDLMKIVETKLTEKEKQDWDLKMKKEKQDWDLKMKIYDQSVENTKQEYELEKMRIDACRQIATEFYKSNPTIINYNNLIW